jgi:hypothetical protein
MSNIENTPAVDSNVETERSKTQRSRRSKSSSNSRTFIMNTNKMELCTVTKLPYDAVFSECNVISTKLVNKGFIAQPGLGGTTFPRYSQSSFYVGCRSPNDFDATFEDMKLELKDWKFHLSAMTNLYRHDEHTNLFVYLKRYATANVLGVYILRYFGDNTPKLLDLR